MKRGWNLLALLPLLFVFSGCPKPPADEPPPAETPAQTAPAEGDANSAATSASDTAKPADSTESATLLEPFHPPSLADLDAQVTWEAQPVVDAFDLTREERAKQPPLVSVDEALSLRNTSPEANEKILSTLGQFPQSESDANYDARFERYTNIELKSTNPIMQSSVAEFEYGSLTGILLIGGDRDLQPHAPSDIVASWQTSSDRLYDKIVLRDDLTWSDGHPVTAHDVEFSFQTIMNPKIPVPAVRSGPDQLKGVKAYDDRTVVFFHKESLATNVWNLQFPIIPKHIYERSIADDYTLRKSDYHVKYESAPVTSGAYRLKSRQIGQEFVLERREDWYMKNGQQIRRKPYFKEVRFQILEDPNTALLAIKNGNIDDFQMNPEQWQTQTGDDDFYSRNTKTWGVEWSYAYIAWNCRNPLFSDKRVRQAMSFALDHKEMLDEICYGLYQPGRGTFHPDAWMAPKPAPEPYQQNLDKAEELLDAAGWTDSDSDGIRDRLIDGQKVDFRFSLLIGEGSKTAERTASLLAENLGQIGVECSARPMEFTVLQQRALDHDFQALMLAWGTGSDPDTTENLFGTKGITGGRNYPCYSNPEVDELYEQGKREFDHAKRAAIYAKIDNILWEDQPYTWLYYRNGFFGFNKKLRGYAFSPRGPYGYSPGLDSVYMTVD